MLYNYLEFLFKYPFWIEFFIFGFLFGGGIFFIQALFRHFKGAQLFQVIPENFRTGYIRRFKNRIYWVWFFFTLLQWAEFENCASLIKLFRGLSSFCLFVLLGSISGGLILLFFKQFSAKNFDIWEGFFQTIQKLCWTFCIFLGFIVASNNLGYSVGGLLTTLGVGGAAIAFASRDTFANIWGTISILFDQPFKIGDWIVIGNKGSGRVLNIGLRSTTLSTSSGSLLSIPNNVLVNELIDNWSDFSNLHIRQQFRLNKNLSVEQSILFLKRARQFLANYSILQTPYIHLEDNVDGTQSAVLNYILKCTGVQDVQKTQEDIQARLRELCS